MSGETQNSEMGLVVVGAGGRMGQTLIRTIQAIEGAKLVGAIERSSSPLLGRDAGEVTGIGPLGVRITDDPLPVLPARTAFLISQARRQASNLRASPHRRASCTSSARRAARLRTRTRSAPLPATQPSSSRVI